MKRLIILFLFGLILKSNAQQASGNITFQTNTPNTTIQAKATSLFANGVHEYDISGNTNTAIPFGPYELDKSASVQEFFNTNKNHIVFGNGSNFLNAYVTANNAKATVYNIYGQVVGHPQVSQVQDNIVSTKMDMSHLSNGLYVVRVNDNAFKFLKTNNPGFRGERINVVSQLAKTASKTTIELNYNISWDGFINDEAGKIVTINQGSQNIDLEDTANNDVVVPVDGSIYFTADPRVRVKAGNQFLDNVNITLQNVQTQDSIYSKNSTSQITEFTNVFTIDENTPTQYNFSISDNQTPKRFNDITNQVNTIVHDDATNRINPIYDIEVTAIEQPVFQEFDLEALLNGEVRNDVDFRAINVKKPDSIYNGNATNNRFKVWLDDLAGSQYRIISTDNNGTKDFEDDTEIITITQTNGIPTKQVNLEEVVQVNPTADIKFISELNNTPLTNVNLFLENKVSGETYTQNATTTPEVLFENIVAVNDSNQYELRITDNETNPRFEPYTTTLQVFQDDMDTNDRNGTQTKVLEQDTKGTIDIGAILNGNNITNAQITLSNNDNTYVMNSTQNNTTFENVAVQNHNGTPYTLTITDLNNEPRFENDTETIQVTTRDDQAANSTLEDLIITGNVNLESILNGSKISDLKYVLTNVQIPDSTYTINTNTNTTLIKDLHIQNNNGAEYTVQTIDNQDPKRFNDDTETITVLRNNTNTNNNPLTTQTINLEEVVQNYRANITVLPLLNGTAFKDVIVTLTNDQVPDSTYTRTITDFNTSTLRFNVHVDQTQNNTYSIEIKDTEDDDRFIVTNANTDISADQTKNLQVPLTVIPNEQDVTFNVRHYTTLNEESGVTVELINKNTGAVIDTQVTNGSGVVLFEDVPGQGEYLTRTSKDGHYTKTVGSFLTPEVDRISEMEDWYNTTTIPYITMSNGERVTAEQANKYNLRETNTELLHKRWNKYLPEAERRQLVIDRMNYVAETLGFSGGITYFTTAFSEPTQEQIDNYKPYETNLPYGNDKIGSNLEYTGANNNPVPRDNGIFPGYTFNTSIYDVGTDNNIIDHEMLQVIGFDPINADSTIPQTALDTTTPSELSIYDIPNVTMKLTIGKNHFVKTISGKPAEYNYKTLELEDGSDVANQNYRANLAILPTFNGTPYKDVIVTLTNDQVPDSTYTRTITDFNTSTLRFNVHVDQTQNNTYSIEIKDTEDDDRFIVTNANTDISADQTKNLQVPLTLFPDFQNITYHTYNSETRELESGVTLIAKSPTDGTVYDTEETVNGNATLTIPENTEYRLEISKAGFLTKTNVRNTTVEDVTRQSLLNASFNTTAIPIQYYDNTANEIATDTLMMYQPTAQYADFILGKARIHYPNRADGTQFYEDIFDDVATLMGIPGAFIKSDTAFGTPTQEQREGYDPRPQTRNTYDGQIGVDITSYTGTSTGRIEKTLDNGNRVTLSTNSFRLGGLTISRTHHEIGNLLGFPLLNGNSTTFKTSRNANGAESVNISESKNDRNIMPFWINQGQLQYVYTDSNNVELEQSQVYNLK